MTDQASAKQFLDEYRATFERFDVAAVAAFFAFPLQVTGDAADVTVVSVPALEAWVPQIERIVGAYRMLGVASADARDVRIVAVTTRITQATVNWVLLECLYSLPLAVAVLAILLAGWKHLYAARREGWGEMRLRYEEEPEPAIHGLNLLK